MSIQKSPMQSNDELVKITQNYYNSSDADEFYYHIWGGEDIHIGLYDKSQDIVEASQASVRKMTSLLDRIEEDSIILDLGSGYGGAARALVKRYQCSVYCLNLSEKQNERNRKRNAELRLAHKITVIDGNFELLPFENNKFDYIWSQDAVLHSPNRSTVFKEAYRVLKYNGEFVFSDPMQHDNCPADVLKAVLERIHLSSLGSFDYYKRLASNLGFKERNIIDLSQQLTNHYSRIKENLRERYDEILKVSSKEYLDRMLIGLDHWINAGDKGYLTWGILHFQK